MGDKNFNSHPIVKKCLATGASLQVLKKEDEAEDDHDDNDDVHAGELALSLTREILRDLLLQL